MELCDDLIVQIVRRLPFKSIIGCRFVSKRWCFLITRHLALLGKYDPCGRYLRKAEYLLGLIGENIYPNVENHTILSHAKVYLFKARDNLIKPLFIHGMNEFEKDAEDSKSSYASFISLKKKWFENLAKQLMDMTKRFNICIKDWDRTGTTSSGGTIILDIRCCCRKHDLKRRKRDDPMLSTMGFPTEYSDPELLEYLALDGAKYRQEERLVRAAKKAFDAKYYSKAAIHYHQAVMLLLKAVMPVTNQCFITNDLSPTFEAIYGRTSSLIQLGQLKEIPKAYQGGKLDKCFYHLYKDCSTLMLMLEQEKFASDDFKLFINDAWNDVFELQQVMRCRHRSVGDCLQELKVLAENVDDSTSWDSVSMREKALKIMDIVNVLDHFKRKVRKLVEQNEISDAGRGHSSVGSNEVKEIVQNI